MTEQKIWFGIIAITMGIAWVSRVGCAQTKNEAQPAMQDRVVRLAELEIDPAQLVAYKAALREEIEASIRMEPGVLALDAVSLKEHSNQIRLFEMYASPAAYRTHLQSAHFQRYKSMTAGMVRSLKLSETDPVMLGTK